MIVTDLAPAQTAPLDLAVGEVCTLLAAIARSKAGKPLSRDFPVEIMSITPREDGLSTVHTRLLNAFGVYTTARDQRTFLVPAGGHTAPVRVGDTVCYTSAPGRPYEVAALHRRTNGMLDAILVDGDGHNDTLHLSSLRLLARAEQPPAEQPCGNRHTPGPCHRCKNADEPVTARCDIYLPGESCEAAATVTLRWTDPCGSHTAHRCAGHGTYDGTIAVTATPMPAGAGTFEQTLGRAPVAVCRGCGHSVSHVDGAWISGTVTACPGLDQGPHQPAVTRKEARLASDARPCPRGGPHDLTRC